MKKILYRQRRLAGVVLLLLLALPAAVRAQFMFTTNNGAITITGYTGNPTILTIPSMTNDHPVTDIGDSAFANNSTLVSVIIPDSVTNIGSSAFQSCISLTNVLIGSGVINIGSQAFMLCNVLERIMVDTNNPAYSSMAGVLFDKGRHTLIQCPMGKGGSYALPSSVTTISTNAFNSCSITNVTIPSSVTNIEYGAFDASGLVSITIPDSVTTIGEGVCSYCFQLGTVKIGNNIISIPYKAFSFCENLTNVTFGKSVAAIGAYAFDEDWSLRSVFFLGNCPTNVGSVAWGAVSAINFYFMPNATGWGTTFQDYFPMVLWNPQAQTRGGSFGVQTNQFGFNITGTTNIPIVVEASTDLNGAWVPLQSVSLTNGAFHFSDPQWTNYPGRFYRIRSP